MRQLILFLIGIVFVIVAGILAQGGVMYDSLAAIFCAFIFFAVANNQ